MSLKIALCFVSLFAWPASAFAEVRQLVGVDGINVFNTLSENWKASKSSAVSEEPVFHAVTGFNNFDFSSYDEKIMTGAPEAETLYFTVDGVDELPILAERFQRNNIYGAGGEADENASAGKFRGLKSAGIYPLYREFFDKVALEKDPVRKRAKQEVLDDSLRPVDVIVFIRGWGPYRAPAYLWGLPVDPTAARAEYQKRVDTKSNFIESNTLSLAGG